MAEEQYSVATLSPELEYLRKKGLGSFDASSVPHLADLSDLLGYRPTDTAVTAAVRALVTAALGRLDGDKLDSSAAWLLGAARGARSLSLQSRSTRAAAKRGVKIRQYNGTPNGASKRQDDLRLTAEALLELLHEYLLTKAPAGRPAVQSPHTLELTTPPPSVQRYLDGQRGEEWIEDRERTCNDLWTALEEQRDHQVEVLGTPSAKVCIFASGSFARREAMEYSDLDLFLVDDAPGKDKTKSGPLTHFERAHTLTFIDRCREERGIQRFSQGGHFQQMQSMKRLLDDGARRDESANLTMTRTLLLTGSRPFHNETLYESMREAVFNYYWRGDNGSSKRPFRPAQLFNDLRRVWLSMLTNFEQFYPKDVTKSGSRVSSPARHVALLKLITAQQLGCYTPILGMMHRSGPDGLLRDDAIDVLNMTTSQRLDDLAQSSNALVAEAAGAVREIYGQYLAFSWCSFQEMSDRIDRPDWDPIKLHFDQVPELTMVLLQEFARLNPKLAKFAIA